MCYKTENIFFFFVLKNEKKVKSYKFKTFTVFSWVLTESHKKHKLAEIYVKNIDNLGCSLILWLIYFSILYIGQ